MSPNEIADTMIENKVQKLVRSPGAPLDKAWSFLGHPNITISNREVQEAKDAGILCFGEPNFALLAPSVLNRARFKQRSASAQKAAETRRNQPPSRCAVNMLLRMGSGFFTPSTYSEQDALKELFSKGFVLKGEFKTPAGKIWAYAITGSGARYRESVSQTS